MGGGTQDGNASDEAWQGALSRTHTRMRRQLDDLVHQKRVHLKPVMTSALTRSSTATSRIMKNPCSAQSRWSKLGPSEHRLGAGSERAKWQLEPVTCSRALAVDGADIAGPTEAVSILCLKGLSNNLT